MAVSRSQPTRILIVDDHPLVRDGLRALIASHADLDVCGEAEDVPTALQQCRDLHPDLAIVDLSFGSIQGLDLIKQLKADRRDLLILVLTMHDEELFGERCRRAGAAGFVSKGVAIERVIDAIRTVCRGQLYFGQRPSAAAQSRSTRSSGPHDASGIDQLSNRELEVFSLLGRGNTTREIAEQLHVSIKTIDTHREKIKRKLSLSSSAELMQHAVRWVLENG